jgi:hypothetical protein
MAGNSTRVQPESNEEFDRRNEFKLENILERMRTAQSRQDARLRRKELKKLADWRCFRLSSAIANNGWQL